MNESPLVGQLEAAIALSWRFFEEPFDTVPGPALFAQGALMGSLELAMGW